MPVILRHQTEAARGKIRAAIENGARALVTGNEIRVPLPGIIIAGQKPENRMMRAT